MIINPWGTAPRGLPGRAAALIREVCLIMAACLCDCQIIVSDCKISLHNDPSLNTTPDLVLQISDFTPSTKSGAHCNSYLYLLYLISKP
jgi:hypothetical protein